MVSLQVVLLVAHVATAFVGLTLQPPNPVADPKALVYCDRYTRFTMLSPMLVRAEYSIDFNGTTARFEDRATLAFVNRRLPVPVFMVANQTDWCNITLKTSGLTISYFKSADVDVRVVKQPSPFAKHRLAVAINTSTLWQASDSANITAANNLGGNVYQLDGVNGSEGVDLTCAGNTSSASFFCTPGVLSRSGVVVYSDESNTVLDKTNAWWARSAHDHDAGGDQDLYIFAPGPEAEHLPTLKTLASISGKVPVPPRRFFGVWWSRWDKYTEQELRDITQGYEANQIPLDGINLDTEWHRNSAGYLDAVGNLPWYSGVFDWDTSLYSNPQSMMDWLEARGLWPVWFDIHQSAGVLPVNSRFAKFVTALGLPSTFDQTVPSQVGDQTYARALMKLLVEQVGGRNYWWLDNSNADGVLDHNQSKHPGLNAVLWDRKVFFDAVNETLVGRPTVMGPHGGLGSHRYPFGQQTQSATRF